MSLKKSLLLFAFLFSMGCGQSATETENVPAPPPSSPAPGEDSKTPAAVVTYEGIDVSHFQHTIDWSAVKKSGMKFVFVKATEGIDLPDPQFSANWEGAQTAGLVRGAYHFYVPEDDPTTQAEFFISNVQLAAGDLVPTLDVEYSKDVDATTLVANIKTWLKTVESALGVTPIVYTDVNFANEFLSSDFGRYPLWIAAYQATAPTVEGSWETWDIWQYAKGGEVDGIAVDVDLDRFQGTAVRWQELLIPESPKG